MCPIGAGVELQGLSVNSDFRKLDISIPLPALRFAPKLSYNRNAYELKTPFDGWQVGVRARLRPICHSGLLLRQVIALTVLAGKMTVNFLA